jgi:Glycosyl transferase family 2
MCGLVARTALAPEEVCLIVRIRPDKMSLVAGFLVLLLVVVAATTVYRVGMRRRQARFIRETLSHESKLHASQRMIAALSTLPDRIDNLEPTIQCLLNQTRPLDEIIIAVPRFSRRQQSNYLIPEYLNQLPRVRVLHCDTDWGPATKFIPVIQAELAAGKSDTLIMIVDDDRIYPNDAVETYLGYHRRLPDAALCFRGGPIPRDMKWGPRMIRGSRIREPQKVAIMTGCGSYLIQPRFFDDRLWDYSTAPAAAFYMDDIWMSGWLDRRGIDKFVVPTSEMMRTVFRQRWTMTLHNVPNGRKRSNEEVLAFFADSWKIFSDR